MSSTIRVVATLATADEAKLRELAKPLIEATRKEDGCILYDLHKNTADGNKYVKSRLF